MSVVERIKSQLAAAPVVLFMKGTPDFPQCGFSAQTVGALRASGARFAAVNIFEDPELREALKRFSNWPTYPQLYINGELIGGCDITEELHASGELARLVAEHGDPVWRAITARMEALLEPAIAVIGEAFAAYPPDAVPFGLRQDDFVEFAMGQFRKRMARLELARAQGAADLLLADLEEFS
jgi:monothiol glutaredoxin